MSTVRVRGAPDEQTRAEGEGHRTDSADGGRIPVTRSSQSYIDDSSRGERHDADDRDQDSGAGIHD
jgi:hypothetical protein